MPHLNHRKIPEEPRTTGREFHSLGISAPVQRGVNRERIYPTYQNCHKTIANDFPMATAQDRAPETTGHSTNANIWAALLCLIQMVLFSQATEAAQSPSEQIQLNQEYEVLERGLAG